MTLSTAEDCMKKTTSTLKASDVLPDFLRNNEEKLLNNDANIEPIRVRTSSLLHNSQDNLYGSGTYDLPQISKCDIACSIERLCTSSDQATYSHIPPFSSRTESQNNQETYSMNSTIPLRTQNIHTFPRTGRSTGRAISECENCKKSTFSVVCCPADCRMPSKVNICLMAVIFVLTCFVSMLSVMVVSAHNLTTSESFDVTTENLNNSSHSGSTIDHYKTNCSSRYDGYCLNGGKCVYLIEEETQACECALNYGGTRCQKYLWYHSKSECEEEKTIDSLKLGLLILVIIFLVLTILYMSVVLRRFFLKIKKLEKEIKHLSQTYDYSAHYLPSTMMYNTQISSISHEKHDMRSRSAPTGIGRLSQNFFSQSQTQPNGLSEMLQQNETKQNNQQNHIKASNGSNSSA